MNELGLVAVALCVLGAAAISRRIQGTILTLPMVYVGLGLLLSGRVLGIVELGLESEIVRVVAELTLVLVLASDASRIRLRRLVRDHSLPTRMLVHVEVSYALADDLVYGRHRLAVDGKAAEGNMSAVGHKTADGACQGEYFGLGQN